MAKSCYNLASNADAQIIYMPFLQKPFHTFSLSAFDWVVVILLAGSFFPVMEVSEAIIG